MIKRKILYGYQIQHGDLVTDPAEAEVVERAFDLYLEGMSYQKITDMLNSEGVPFHQDTPLWNKHRVKRLLENPRYTGQDGYPIIVDKKVFHSVQNCIAEKTSGYTAREERLALRFQPRCSECGGRFLRQGGRNRRDDTLYYRCEGCGVLITITDADLLKEVSRQVAEHDLPSNAAYLPSQDVIRLDNAIDRGLEHPDRPEDVVTLILKGISARYDRCPTVTVPEPVRSIDWNRLRQTVSHITISTENAVTVHFRSS